MLKISNFKRLKLFNSTGCSYMITEEHIKEGLSRAYTIAVAHRAGMNYCSDTLDYGIDGTFRDVIIRENRRCNGGHSIDFQLKATVDVEIGGGYIIYDLESKNFNDLRETEIGTPRILILFVMPSDSTQWLNISDSGTILKNCAWWHSLKGLPPTQNTATKRIKIPINQILTVDALHTLMNKVKQGEEL